MVPPQQGHLSTVIEHFSAKQFMFLFKALQLAVWKVLTRKTRASASHVLHSTIGDFVEHPFDL